ncbi:hypothetical protein MMPV_009115 [Pyropia vietnamensis]
MGRTATLLMVFAVAALSASSVATSTSITSAQVSPNAAARAVSRAAGNIVMGAVEASADAMDNAPPGTDFSEALDGKRAFRPRRDHQAKMSVTCMTVAEFKADVAETVAAMKEARVPAQDIEGFERTLLNGYKDYIIREEGNKFCVRTSVFADWIVDVYVAALSGKLRQ